MSLATDLQGDVAELLDDPDYGRDVTLRRYAAGAYNPSDGSTATATIVNIQTRGLFLKINDRLIDGRLIKKGDRRCIIKLKGITYVPSEGDLVVAGAEMWTVISFSTIELAGTAVIHTLQVRK